MKLLRQFLFLSCMAISALSLHASNGSITGSTSAQDKSTDSDNKANHYELLGGIPGQASHNQTNKSDDVQPVNNTNYSDRSHDDKTLDELSEEINTINETISGLEKNLKQDDTFKQNDQKNTAHDLLKAKQERTRLCRYYNEKYDAENRNHDSDAPMTIEDIKRMHESRAAIVAWLCNNLYISKQTEQEVTLSEQTNLLPKKYLDQYENLCEQKLLQKIAQRRLTFYETLTVEEKVIILARIQELQRVTEENEAKKQQLQETQSQSVVDTEKTLQQ